MPLLRRSLPLVALVRALVVAALPSATFGHPEIAAALERLNVAIASKPAAAELYLERGDLYAKHSEWVSAEANYARASELNSRLHGLERAHGLLALATGNLVESRRWLDAAIMSDPSDAEAYIYRARVRAKQRDPVGARVDFASAVRHATHPTPELILEQAGLSETAGDALRCLEAGIARVGPAHTLVWRAIELECATGQVDAALARLDLLIHRSERKETLLKHRGDLLARFGRGDEARAAYRAALLAIAALPEWLRESPATQQLAAELNSTS